MNRFTQFVIAAACSLPLLAVAQTGGSMAPAPKVQPAGEPRSDLEKDQTQHTGQASKYGQEGSADSTQTTANTSTKSTKSKHAMKAKKGTDAEGTDTTSKQ